MFFDVQTSLDLSDRLWFIRASGEKLVLANELAPNKCLFNLDRSNLMVVISFKE